METVVKTRGVMGRGGQILAADLPFEEGESVEMMVWPASVPVRTRAERLQALEDWLAWTRESHPDLPTLSDEAMSRESIYEVRGL